MSKIKLFFDIISLKYQTISYSIMFGHKLSKDKGRKISQSRTRDRNKVISQKKVVANNRSSSIYQDKKQYRFSTDYGQYQASHTANITNYTKFQKKMVHGRRRDTFDCQFLEDPSNKVGVQSTKYNPNKNLEIKGLFKAKQERSISRKNKQINTNHPLLKFMSKKNNKDKAESPYSKALYPRNTSVQSKNSHSLSTQKQLKSSVNKKPLHINKQQISLRAEIKKDTKIIGLRQQKTQKLQCQKKEQAVKKGKVQQSTVKTIKKQRDDLNESLSSNQSYGLTEQEEQIFGDRFPYGFQKMKLLGRGGFSLVWLGKHSKSGKQFAIKQIITKNTHQTHLKQIWFGTMFFTLGGVPRPEFSHYPGVKNLVRLYSYEINQADTWIFYQKCGQSLGSGLYDIKSEKLYGDQKLYKIFYKDFYRSMSLKPKIFYKLILQLCKSLALLSQCQVVHSDLKTQNILIKYEKQGKDCQLKQVKLIDYGSSFQFKNLAQFSMATPQYMPPQILNYIIHQNEGEYQKQLYESVMNHFKNPWAVDIWSLGCVIVQIVVGVPLWMSLPLLVPSKHGTWLQKQGLFAVKGRLFNEIIKKQRSVNPHIEEILQRDNYSRIELSPNIRQLVKRMLDLDFNRRVSPLQAIAELQKQIALSE